MMFARRLPKYLLKLLSALLLLGVIHTANSESEDAVALQSRLEFVEKLLVESSAAKQVESGNNSEALELRALAIRRYEQAVNEQANGDLAAMETNLSEAIRFMFDAVAKTKDVDESESIAAREYQKRRDSVEALLEAHQRISTEKGQQRAHGELRVKVEKELLTSELLIQSGHADEAREHIDEAYDMLQLGIGVLRGGDTLVRRLEFENAEEEYRYEIDRNDTHLMLVQILLSERLKDEQVQKRADPMLQQAAILRSESEEKAENGKFSEAIKLLESSTGELVKAIRSAGVYIPG